MGFRLDGNNSLKLATSSVLTTLGWAHDGSQLMYADNSGGESRAMIVGADGHNLHQIEYIEGFVSWGIFSADDKALYLSTLSGNSKLSVWKAHPDGSQVQKLLENCGNIADSSLDGERLLGLKDEGEDVGIYQVSVKDKQCIPLLPGMATSGAHYSPDGKAVLYPVTSHGQVTFYRQVIQGDKPVGKPQVALKLPFNFPLDYNGNAFDFSPDLSTIVYARPGGQADFYKLTLPQ